MEKEDIRTITRFGRSLWGDFNRSLALSEDALTSASLLRLSRELIVERASKTLIERAEKFPPTILKLTHPFYRLAPIERFLLTALHLEKWGYTRIGRTLGVEANLVEPWAWATRIKFCFQEMDRTDIEYPRGSTALGPSCPAYNPSAPWAQRLLDDELENRERGYLQNHLMACDRCRKTLEITRKMMFKVEEMIPNHDSSPEEEQATERLYLLWKQGEAIFRPSTMTISESLLRFINRPKTQFILVASAILFICLITRKTP